VCVCAVIHHLPLGCLQSTSIRLLLNLVSNIYRMGGPPPRPGEAPVDPSPAALEAVERAKGLLVRVMYTIIDKFGTLQHYIPRALTVFAQEEATRRRHSVIERELRAGIRAGTDAIVSPDLSASDDSEPWKLSEEALGSIKDIKAMMKTMTMGLKTVMWCLSNLRSAQATATVQPGMHDTCSLYYAIACSCVDAWMSMCFLVSLSLRVCVCVCVCSLVCTPSHCG
jgi:hypothetical protein